jgi:hypothetical protein
LVSRPGKAYSAGPAAFFLRRRANAASAPIPNSATIGGSGTSVPELVLVLLLVELEVLVDELVDELVELEVEELVDVLEVMLPEVEVLVETLPEVEVEEPPVLVEVDEPPVDVEVEEPPLDVEVELPLTLTITPLLELPEVEPLVLVLVVELIEM